MKREPSTFSYIKVLDAGYSVALPIEKAYAARCACAYLEAEYGRTFTVTTSPDGGSVIIRRLT